MFGKFCGSDARQDHLLQSLLPGRRKLARLDVEFPVTTEFEKGVHIAYANELGVLRVVPRCNGLGNLDEGMALGDQERVRFFVEEEMEERVPDF